MRHLTTTAALILALALAGQARAVEVGSEQDEGATNHIEDSNTSKKNMEKKRTDGSKRTGTRTTGSDQTTSATKKKGSTATRSHSLDMQASLMMLFEAPLDELAPLKPILPGDVGLTAQIQPGYIDTVKASLLKEAAASNAGIASVGADQEALTRYALDVADRGAIAAQAARYLADDIAELQKKRPAKAGEFEITTLGADDLERLARGAVKRVFQAGPPAYHDRDIAAKLESIKRRIEAGRGSWRFAGSTEKLTPGGGVELTLAVAPHLAASGVSWYSPNNSSFGGYSVSYKVSSAWSLADSLEALKSSSKYSKQATELAAYIESIEAKGMSKEAAMLRKQAVEAAAKNKASINPLKYLHMPGGE